MALLVLISGSGLAISTHVCASDGKVETDLFRRLDGCCSEKFPSGCNDGGEQGIKSECCKLTVAYEKVQVVSSVSGSQKKQVKPSSSAHGSTFGVLPFTQAKLQLKYLSFRPPGDKVSGIRSVSIPIFSLYSCFII